MSNPEPIERWEPNAVFVKQKSKESNFTKEEEANPQTFQETSLIAPAENSEELDQPAEDLDDVIEPLKPLEPIHSQELKEPALDIEAAKQQAYSEGEAKGRIEGQRLAQESSSELQQQFEIEARDEISRFMSSVRASLTYHNALAEPLKKLAVSLAEFIARAELQLSAKSIDNLVDRVVSELEPSELEDVVIAVSPGWYRQLTSEQFKGIFENCEIQASEQLSDGSVRLSLQDKSIEYLLEDRISEIASQVFNLKFPDSSQLIQQHYPASTNVDNNLLNPAINDVSEELVQEIDVEGKFSGSKEMTENSQGENILESDLSESRIDHETSFVLEPPASEGPDFKDDLAEEDG